MILEDLISKNDDLCKKLKLFEEILNNSINVNSEIIEHLVYETPEDQTYREHYRGKVLEAKLLKQFFDVIFDGKYYEVLSE